MSREPSEKALDLGNRVRVSPPVWSDHRLKVQPGDLSMFVPTGNGVYGYQKHQDDPFASAPLQEACGGVACFDNHIAKADFEVLVRVMSDWPAKAVEPSKGFAVFTAESRQPGTEHYLAQMRIVSKFGLRFMFDAITNAEYDNFPEQELTVAEVLWSFIEHERERWGTEFCQDRERGLQGLFGGDGNFAREELAFGFMVENCYHGVYRLWSRAWLVTK